MGENRFPCGSSQLPHSGCKEPHKDTVCIETHRMLDSCRDRDCFENVKVFLTELGQDVINHTTQVRAKDACIAWTYIGIDPVQFNRGFYAITIRFYIKIVFEGCVCPGRSQEFDGIAVLEKLLPEMVCCHLHDNGALTDAHARPGKGLLDWNKIVPLLKKAPRLQAIQSEVSLFRDAIGCQKLSECFNNLFNTTTGEVICE